VHYASVSSGASERIIRPLGLVLKAGTWYLLARSRTSSEDRIYRLSRVVEVVALDHRFDWPTDFDLADAWDARKEAFTASIPTYYVEVRVAPGAEGLLPRLHEGAPALPLPDDVKRDAEGWAHLRLKFEARDSAARHLLELG